MPVHSDARILLIHSSGTLGNLPAVPTYALSDDLEKHHSFSPYPQISYAEMLEMLFESERVVVL